MTEHKTNSGEFALVPFEIVASWPVGTFLENIAVRDDGSILVSVFGEGTIYHISTAGTRRIMARLPQPVTGIVVSGSSTYLCSGSPGKPPWTVFHVDDAATLYPVVSIPNSLLLNGFTPFRGKSALAVDSYLGAIFEVDLEGGSYRTWLRHDLLAKSTDRKVMPGVNGIKCFGDSVFVTNTDSGRIIKIPVSRNGNPEDPMIIEHDLIGDDFAFDRDGALYVATHSGNGILKLSQRGERTIIAGPLHGMAGSTACAFGRTATDAESLYVTTTGGIVSPYEGEVQPAKLVRLEVGAEGHPLSFT